ncbi:MAG TPA: LEA type 2 family protein [Spongiibacteraceae bacterium]|nr:LEA type 2 family protein [Spongiibacteraceae bacterium]
MKSNLFRVLRLPVDGGAARRGMHWASWFIPVLLMALLSHCSLLPRPEAPSVQLVGLQVLPSQGMEQQIRVRLKVINPNDYDIPLTGISLKLGLSGHDLLSGGSHQALVLPALGDARMDVDLSLDLLAGLGLFQTLMGNPDKPLEYHLSGKAFLSQTLMPSVPFEHKGTIVVQGGKR